MFRNRVVGLVVAACVMWLPMAPPEHVHDVDVDGQHHAIVHRHAIHQHAAADHTGTAVFDADHAADNLLSSVFTRPAQGWTVTFPIVSAFAVLAPPPVLPLAPNRTSVEHLIHGPPRAPSQLRAPPALTV